MKLSELKCKNAKHDPTKTIKLFDGQGLALWVLKTGTKCWRYSYRYNNKQKTLVLGKYPEMSLKEARTKRMEARSLLDDGKDPHVIKNLAKTQAIRETDQTFETVTRRWHDIQKSKLSEDYAELVISRMERDAFPYIGNLPINEIKPMTMLDVLRKVEARGAIETAHRLRAKCSEVFCFAIIEQLIESDPTVALKKALQTPQSEHFACINTDEIDSLIRDIKYNTQAHPTTLNLITLMMLIFVRTSELIKAEWSWVNFEDRVLIIPSKNMKMKSGDHIVPLSTQAVAILKDQQENCGKRKYIFPSPDKPRQPISNNALTSALYDMGYKGKMTGHGFRSLANTIIIEKLGYDSAIPDRQLGHIVKDKVVRAYNRAQYLEQRTKMMQDWGDYIENIYKDV